MLNLAYIGKQGKTLLIPSHSHPTLEIICCTHGGGSIQFDNGNSIEYISGELLIIPANIKHMNKSSSGFKNIYLHISNQSIFTKTPFKAIDTNGQIKQLLEHLLLVSAQSMKNRSLIIQNYLDLILNLIHGAKDTTKYSEFVEKLKDKLIVNLSDCDFKIVDYLLTFPLNAEYLRKLFTKETGISPLKFLLKIRMENAERLLSLTSNNMKIEEISLMSGFSDPLYFSRQFKKYYGVAPSKLKTH
ncbi:MAG: AraC family transcriptional regulator [Christensenellaceae bacterium]|nr:AraC family transcriptional regulator [Christensenellaceae bacterium]